MIRAVELWAVRVEKLMCSSSSSVTAGFVMMQCVTV